MASPVGTLTLGGTDITADMADPEGGPWRWGRGAAFDLGAEAPGYAVFRVRNDGKKYNPENGASSLAGVLEVGAAVRLSATYSAVSYYPFHGNLRRIVPLPHIKMAELHCQDPLFNLSRKEVNLAASFSRNIRDFRGAVLDEAGEDPANRNLPVTNGPENWYGYTAADARDALSVLNDLNAGTGTIHYIKPTATAYQYTTIDRLSLQEGTSVETWSDTDFTKPFATELRPYDYTDEGVILSQRVRASPRQQDDLPTVVWERGLPLRVNAGVTETVWANFDDPVFSQYLSYISVGAAPSSVSITPFARSAKIVVTAGAGAVELRDLSVVGNAAPVIDLGSYLAGDDELGFRGGEISSDYIGTLGQAQALANYIVWRYGTLRARPSVTFTNRFPTQLAREIGDRITLTSAELSLSAVDFLIRSFETRVRNGTWETTYELEQAPPPLSLVHVGGSAGNGIGSTATLGY